MAIRVPERRELPSIPVPQRRIPVEQIIQTQGFNPLAAGIATAGNVLGDAMQKRNELRRKMLQNQAIEKAYGLNPGELSGIEDTDAALSMGKYMAESRRPTVVNVIGADGQERQIVVPPGSKFGGNIREPGKASETKPPSPPKPAQKVGLTAEGYPVSFDPNTKTNVVAKPKPDGGVEYEPYFGHPLPLTQGTEEQRRQGLTQAGKASINDVKRILETSPQTLTEVKAIQYTPGNVYRQFASPLAKQLYTNLANAIQTEAYVTTGATMNEQELERKTLQYMVALNDMTQDTLMRLAVLERNITSFTPRKESSTQPVVTPKKATHRWNSATGQVEVIP